MSEAHDYVLGQSADAARRLAIQDAHLAEVSERLLDRLALRPQERVVELGCGAGSFSRRVLARLGAGGVLVGVDTSQGLLDQATAALGRLGPVRFEPVLADVAQPGPWLDGADVIVARTMLHHVPMVEFLLGRLRAVLRPGTRLGFIEPDFRSLCGRIGALEATGRTDVRPLRVWLTVINDLYELRRLSPDVGASLARTLRNAGYQNVVEEWSESQADTLMIENMLMFYDEVRDRLQEMGILTAAEIDEQQGLLRALNPTSLPAVWGAYRVICTA